MLCKLNFTSFAHNAIILVSVSFRVRFPITLDQSNDSEYVTFEKTKYFSGFVQLFVSKILSTKKQVPFQFNTQQDVPEILQVGLDELKVYSAIARNILAICVGSSTTCDTCGCCNIDEVKLDIIRLPLAKSISLYLDISFFWKSDWSQQMALPSMSCTYEQYERDFCWLREHISPSDTALW